MTDSAALTDGAAAQTGPKGFGGWLVIPIAGLILTMAFSLYLVGTGLLWFSEPVIRRALLTAPSLAHLLIGFQILSGLALFVLGLLCLARLKRHLRSFPSLMIVFLCAHLAVRIVEAVLAVLYYESINRFPPAGGSTGALLGVLIWVP